MLWCDWCVNQFSLKIMKAKISHFVLCIALAIISIGGFFLIYLYFIDGVFVGKPLTHFDSTVLETTQSEYKRGEAINVNWHFCKGVNDVATIKVNMVDGVVVYLPKIEGVRQIGCYDGVDNIVKSIPNTVDNGLYHIEADVYYQVNKVKRIYYHFISNDFMIVGGAKPDFTD